MSVGSGLFTIGAIVGMFAILATILYCSSKGAKVIRGRRRERRGTWEAAAITVTQVTAAGPSQMRIPLRDPDEDVCDEDGFVLVPEPIPEAEDRGAAPYPPVSATAPYPPVGPIGGIAPYSDQSAQPPSYSEAVSQPPMQPPLLTKEGYTKPAPYNPNY